MAGVRRRLRDKVSGVLGQRPEEPVDAAGTAVDGDLPSEHDPAGAEHPAAVTEESDVQMAGVTTEAVAAMAVATARNILSVLDGAPNKENTINPEVYG